MDGNRRERSSSSFGLFREGAVDGNGRRKIGKFRLSFGVVAVSLSVITIVFFAVQLNRSKKIDSIEDSKRFVNYPASPSGETYENVSVVPEARAYPNHRYEESADEGRTTRGTTEVRRSPMEEESKIKLGNLNNIQDIIRRLEMKEKLRKPEEKSLSRKPIVFKGVYLKKPGREEEEETEYFKEINELLQSDRKGSHKKKAYSDRASPFRLRDEAEETPRKTSKKPITVMLDIYPVVEQDVGGRTKAKESSNAEPIANAGGVVTYTLVPLKRGQAGKMPDRSGMILKLNLYPKDWGRFRHRVDPYRRKLQGRHFRQSRRRPGSETAGGKWTGNRGHPGKGDYVVLKLGRRERVK